ncbi:hypothetical protein BC832DRAFT_547657 [Gaertneriomyces semiglobifer]|nr:hypothetical protein BC832DRAFT_547657 [Gaertneriomyces semiglobifer]
MIAATSRRNACAPSLLRPLARLHARSFVTPTNQVRNTGTPAAEHEDAKPADTATSKAKAIVSSILHGSEKAKSEAEAQTHSKILARGKFAHELQIHNVKPEAMSDYIQLLKANYPRISEQPQFQARLFGSWSTEFGELDQAVHIWEYNNYPGYIATQKMLKQDAQYQTFLKELAPMLRSRQNQMLLEFSFWQGGPPAAPDGIYELRSYLLKPGCLLEWETEWRRGLEARKRFVQPVGAWFSQLGPLNWVHHMWAYPDLQTRKEMREKAWQVDGWSKTVSNTVRYINEMNAIILKPMPFSPLK